MKIEKITTKNVEMIAPNTALHLEVTTNLIILRNSLSPIEAAKMATTAKMATSAKMAKMKAVIPE